MMRRHNDHTCPHRATEAQQARPEHKRPRRRAIEGGTRVLVHDTSLRRRSLTLVCHRLDRVSKDTHIF